MSSILGDAPAHLSPTVSRVTTEPEADIHPYDFKHPIHSAHLWRSNSEEGYPMNDTNSTSITTPLAPTQNTTRVAQRVLGFLRHPRSLVRINPSWRAPQTPLPSTNDPAIHTIVTAYRRRISSAAWVRLTGQQPPSNAVGERQAPELYVVTLHANASGKSESVDKAIRNSTAAIHALFRLIAGDSMHEITAIAEAQQDGSRSWTWQALLTGEQLRQRELSMVEPIHPHAA